MKNKFSIIVPCYNEELSIKKLIDEIIQISFNDYEYELIIINDGSNDQTLEIITNLSKKHDFIKIIDNKINKGQSYSIHSGIKKAKFKNIVTIDADGQNDPTDIKKLLEIYFDGKYLLVGGIRTKRKDKLIKIFSSRIANYIRKRILNDDCNDTGCSLKVLNKTVFLKLPYFDGLHRFLPALYKANGCLTKFVEVNHRERLLGVSKYGTLDRLFKGIKDLVKVYRIIKKY